MVFGGRLGTDFEGQWGQAAPGQVADRAANANLTLGPLLGSERLRCMNTAC
jgi:hypothetical protein